MSGFSVDWLCLREPFDRAAREASVGMLDLCAHMARWRDRSASMPFTAIDLACGHGANLRALAPRLGGAQRWRLVDHDPLLLAAVPRALAEWARAHDCRIEGADAPGEEQTLHVTGSDFRAEVVLQRVDLARDLATLDFGAASLVTASALLDLVSAAWLEALIRKAQVARSAMLFGLNVDGRLTWDPADPLDDRVHGLFSRHQHRDKGFGPALGPRAVPSALQHMASGGYETLQVPTDWVIDGAQAPAMQLAMIEGVAAAALEQDATARDAVRGWKTRRSAAVGASRLRVGHVDIGAIPA